MFSKGFFPRPVKTCHCVGMGKQTILFPIPKQQDSSKLKDFADNSFKSGENGRKFSNWVENKVGKGEIADYEQFLLSPQCFQKTSTADT